MAYPMNKILEHDIIKEWKATLLDTLPASFPYLNLWEIEEAIDDAIMLYIQQPTLNITNSITKKELEGSLLEIMDYIHSRDPVITSNGVLFLKRGSKDNPLTKMIIGFLEKRSKLKKMMFTFPKGSAEFKKYNLGQLLEKRNANAVYGSLGNCNCIYYNIDIAGTITRQGRSYISCSMTLFESFLGNNVKFNSLNEVITFMHNIVKEGAPETRERRCDDSVILDRDILVEECFIKLMDIVDYKIWIPSELEMNAIWEYLVSLSQEDINRIYYKNNLYDFCNNTAIMNRIKEIMVTMDTPFMDCNKPPKSIQNRLEDLKMVIKEYVYYHYFYIDKLDRIDYMERDVVCITDTDSCIVSFDAWYHFVLEQTYDLDMPMKHWEIDKVDLINAMNDAEDNDTDLIVPAVLVKPVLDYDFYTNEAYETWVEEEPTTANAKDFVRYGILNIIGYICGDLVKDYLKRYTMNTGSYVEGFDCRMVMKNKFCSFTTAM